MSERSVSKAALKVGITQPAMSNGLKRLREQLGDPLFIRTRHGMEPTEKALQLLEPVHSALNELRVALSPAEPFTPLLSNRTFTIAGTDYMEQLILPKVLNKMEEKAPGISFNCVRVFDSTLDKVDSGQIDAVIHQFDEPLPEGFYQKHLHTDRLTCVVRRGHPLLKKITGNKIDLETYLEYGHIMITKTGIGKGFIDSLLETKKLERQTVVNVRQSSSSPVMMVLDTNLIATVPALYAEKYAKLLPIKLLTLPFEIPDWEMSMVWSPLSHHNEAHLFFRRVVFEVCDDFELPKTKRT